MKLTIQNFAKIREADIEINGLSVIAGSNGSGKSTVGKLFFCMLNAAHKTKQSLRPEKIRRVKALLEAPSAFTFEDFLLPSLNNEADVLAKKIVDRAESPPERQRNLERLNAISETDFLQAMLFRLLNLEFSFQLLHFDNYQKAYLTLLNGEYANLYVEIEENSSLTVTSSNILGLSEAFYLDSPYILDEKDFGIYHRQDLKNRLSKDEDELTQAVFEQLLESSREPGDDIIDEFSGNGNIATGLKTFLMLKELLANGYLKENNLLILDEPEIHLHPDWQLTLAEMLVKLVKTFNTKILLNTHSPYFLEALEVFAQKHKISDKCKYYLTIDEGAQSSFLDTTHNLEAIYARLSAPFDKLEKLRNDYYDKG